MDKVYIYDWEQALYYILHDVIPNGSPKIDYRTKKIYFEFDKEDTKELYKRWNNF